MRAEMGSEKTSNSKRKQQKTQQMMTMAHPTSPWTEAYQAAPSNNSADQPAAAMSQSTEPTFDSEDQRPTHDALSDIYNRGY